MIDYSLMSKVIDYNKYKYNCFKNYIQPIENKDYERILKARYNKISRIRKRFLYLFRRYKYLYFCTFTFDDDFIKKCDRTKKDLIKSCLYDFDDDIKYIINIDYGSKSEREHYHGIIATNCSLNFISFVELNYPFFTKVLPIRLNTKSLKLVSKYMNKLCNHATKSTTRNSRVLYNFKGYDSFSKEDSKLLYFLDSIFVGLT